MNARRSVILPLIIATVVAFLWQVSAPGFVETNFALWPWRTLDGIRYFRPWQLLTYAFLHDTRNLSHLIFNMLGLWMFGGEVERALGAGRTLAIYFGSVVAAALTQMLLTPLFGGGFGPTIGASGGVFGFLLVYALLFPRRRVILLFPPIPMPAWLFATGYAAVELVLGVSGRMSDVAHFAHLGGMVGALLVMAPSYFRGPENPPRAT